MLKPGTNSHLIRSIELDREANSAREAYASTPTAENEKRLRDALARLTEFNNGPYRKR